MSDGCVRPHRLHAGWVAALTLVFCCGIPAAMSHTPPPVDLPIRNIPQETAVWCWAAVAQQIIMASRGPQATPPQCALVARAYGQSAESCCNAPWSCAVTGHLHQIQGLIREFGGRSSSLAPPTDPMTLYRTLSAGRAVIMGVKTSPYAGHVVVVRGMGWVPAWNGLQPVLYVNDPMAWFTQPIPFEHVARYWDSAIIVNQRLNTIRNTKYPRI